VRAIALVTSIVASLLACMAAALPAFAAPKSTFAGAATAPSMTDPSAPSTTTPATTTTPTTTGGGATFGVDPNQTPDMPDATVIAGKAYPPVDAPIEVKEAIWAANEIVGKPYKYGGGHAKVKDTGYDCSGTVSYALLGGGLLEGTPLDSSSFMKWGDPGQGDWVTVYTNPGHAYVVIAGLRLDTSAAGDPSGNSGPQWRPVLRSSKGFKARHPEGF
jgi:cell wall-associated NlpC family hydrolase